MELTYNELKKRDVINIADGRCLGRITDIKLRFPQGVLVGIFVPGRKRRGIFACFDKSEMFIEESKILKIGGDVILVDIRCKDPYDKPHDDKHSNSRKPCPPDHKNLCSSGDGGVSYEQFGAAFSERLSDEDY